MKRIILCIFTFELLLITSALNANGPALSNSPTRLCGSNRFADADGECQSCSLCSNSPTEVTRQSVQQTLHLADICRKFASGCKATPSDLSVKHQPTDASKELTSSSTSFTVEPHLIDSHDADGSLVTVNATVQTAVPMTIPIWVWITAGALGLIAIVALIVFVIKCAIARRKNDGSSNNADELESGQNERLVEPDQLSVNMTQNERRERQRR